MQREPTPPVVVTTAELEHMRLGDVAEVRLGVTPRSRPVEDSTGEIRTAQLKNIAIEGFLDPSNLTRVRALEAKPSQYVRRGDILLGSRGAYRAGLVQDDLDDVVALAPLYILTPKIGAVLPEYLAFFLNSEATQAFFRRFATGSHVAQISRNTIDELTVPIPHLTRQRDIADAVKLLYEERNLAVRLCDLKLRLIAESLR